MRPSRLAAAALAGVLTLGSLAACAPEVPTPTPTMPTATSTSSPSPTATPVAAATRMLVLPAFVGIYDSSGDTIDSYDYFVPLDTMVAELSGHFGFAPIVAHVEQDVGGDGHSYTSYDWEGFELRDWDGPASADPYIPEFFIVSAVATVGAVSIETSDGASVGDSTDSLAAANPATSFGYGGQFGPETEIRIFEMEPVPGRYGPIRLAVRLSGPTGGTIDSLTSPSPDMQM